MGLNELFIKNLIEGTMIFSEVPYDRQQYIKDKLKEMVDNNELEIEVYNSIMYNILVNPDIMMEDNKPKENESIIEMDLDSFSLQSYDE